MVRYRITLAIVIVGLAGLAWYLPQLRRALVKDVITWDAPKTDPAPLPAGDGPGLAPVARTRVVLVDGLGEATAKTLPAWTAACKRGITLRIDVGFPTVSLPVEVALWTGLTQQQTGVVFRDRRPLVPPLGAHAIPAQVPRSIAVAEYYGWIARSLGFHHTEPAADPANAVKDADAEAWKGAWEARALAAVTSPAPLAFVHILRVDSTGHKFGVGADYARVAAEADAIVGRLVAADPDARWFLLSDHGHVAAGGHGGEEAHVRQVQGCITGSGITPAVATGLVHIVDIARAIADSTGAKLDKHSRGRPLSAALAVPLERDQAVPPMALGTGALAIFVLVAGFATLTWSVRRWWLAPWWFVATCATLFVVRGEPTLSMRLVYAPVHFVFDPDAHELWLIWLPALGLAIAATVVGLRRTTIARVVISQVALPVAAAAAVLTACGAWPAVFGAEVAPVVPRYTAWMSPMLLMVAHGSAAVALACLATLVRPGSDRFARREPPRSEPAAES